MVVLVALVVMVVLVALVVMVVLVVVVVMVVLVVVNNVRMHTFNCWLLCICLKKESLLPFER